MCTNPNSTAVLSSICGFSRMGPNRELKTRVEAFWKEQSKLRTESAIPAALAESIGNFEKDIQQLQIQRWQQLKATGIDLVPSGDYSLYDHVLDCAVLFNAIPQRYQDVALDGVPSHLRVYFAMARGLQEKGADVPALPMKKWFDTNYHFIAPELAAEQQFSATINKPLADFLLAKNELNLITKPVLLGPITFLHLSHVIGDDLEGDKIGNLALLPALLAEYAKIIGSLVEAGAKWIQVDEPLFGLSFKGAEGARAYYGAFKQAAQVLEQATAGNAHLIFATYFNGITSNLQIVRDLPAGTGIHVDLVRAPKQLEPVLDALPSKCFISLGLVEGRNIWLSPLQKCCDLAQRVVARLGKERVLVGTSCSLLHVPYSTKMEKPGEIPKTVTTGMETSKIIHWLAFGIEKCEQVVTIAKQLNGIDCSAQLDANNALLNDHSVSGLIHSAPVKKRVANIESAGVQSYYRQTPYHERIEKQKANLKLPPIPTTTIGSFPQSAAVRAQRAKFKTGKIGEQEYWAFINAETEKCIRIQEKIGLDVLVHGEFERNDMVEFFAEHLNGFCVTSNGWVQSYGSRCVKPPVLYGDVQRSGPMTVAMIKYTQGLTAKPVKGMLTGPMTILKWSFVRNDQPIKDTAFQIALSLRDEVAELEEAGIKCIQMDEPAFREGLPLEPSLHNDYLITTVQAFKISTGCVADGTQIYSHMCYSEFSDIFTHIADLDADVLCIECSRSELSLLSCFDRFGYPLMVGPGLYDIHSPRVPGVEELKSRLLAMLKYIPPNRLFANPDCGLKTRDWLETEAALAAMVQAVQAVRKQFV